MASEQRNTHKRPCAYSEKSKFTDTVYGCRLGAGHLSPHNVRISVEEYERELVDLAARAGTSETENDRLRAVIAEIAKLPRYDPCISRRPATDGQFLGMETDATGEYVPYADIRAIIERERSGASSPQAGSSPRPASPGSSRT